MTFSLAKRDRSLIWHPFTHEKGAPLPIPIVKAQDSYLFDEQGKAYLDLISSWWVNLHGHSHPTMAKAIYEQAQNLEHVMFAGFTHEPAVKLCELLQTVLPTSLARFFFSDNGSTSVEVALKMAYQFFKNKGESRRSFFLSFQGGYHGDTFGCMSVGKKSGYHDAFLDLFFRALTVPFPNTYQDDPNVQDKEAKALLDLERILETHGHEIAALIVEPLVQGAGGMRMCRKEFLNRALDLVKSYGIFIIFDEVMTGFGRTGTFFALDQIDDIVPDFLCLSKGLTGGFLPLALTVTTNEIYESFTDLFAHGHSYTANPLACAAALASFQLLKDAPIDSLCQAQEEGLKTLTCVQGKRQMGTITAFEVEPEKVIPLKNLCVHSGLLLRPLKNTFYTIPPYCTTREEVLSAYSTIASHLHDIS